MNKNKEMLDKIAMLRTMYPEASVIFLVSAEEMTDDHDYEEQTLKSVEFDVAAKIEKADDTVIVAGKDNIESYLEEQIFENELSLADGNFDLANARNPEEVINLKVKDVYEKYQQDGIIVPAIVVYLGG